MLSLLVIGTRRFQMASNNHNTLKDTITVTGSDWYDVGSTISTVTLSPLTASSLSSNITIDSSWSNGWSASASVSNQGQLSLNGDEADIKINGESLMSMIRVIEQRLNILKPNEKLEADWDQLRELGEAYRKLEAEIVEKQKMWDTLKK